MPRHHRVLARSLFALLIVAASSVVQADPDIERLPPRNGYSYVFTDDPLAAGGLGPHEVPIRVRRQVGGGTLIRPRNNFVPELLKTVESL